MFGRNQPHTHKPSRTLPRSNSHQPPKLTPPVLRENKGAVIFNAKGKLLCGRRKDFPEHTIWQLPQGGIESNEDPIQAILREIEEETGITADRLTLLPKEDQIGETFRYIFPFKRDGMEYDGQRQEYFVFKFNGEAMEELHPGVLSEFSEIGWKSWDELMSSTLSSRVFIYDRIHKKTSNLFVKCNDVL